MKMKCRLNVFINNNYIICIIVSESDVKSRIESHISQKVNSHLDSIYNDYYRDLEECSGNIDMIETIPEMKINNNAIDSFVNDYGSHFSDSNYVDYLTNKYISVIARSYGNYYYKRLVYDIEIKNDNVCNSTINIKTLNYQSSIIFFSDSYRYGQMKENYDLEMRYYTCQYIYIYIYYI